jgi:hypothetical protein
MTEVKQLVARLSRYYWSPNHPTTYTTPEGRGLGRLAPECYGTFNLVWATHKLDTVQDHLKAISAFTEQKALASEVVKGAEIGSWLTLLQPHEMAFWLQENRGQVSRKTRTNIERALNALQDLRRV